MTGRLDTSSAGARYSRLAGVAGAVMLSGCVTGGPGRVDAGENATPALNDEAAKDPAAIAEASAMAATAQGANTATAIPD